MFFVCLPTLWGYLVGHWQASGSPPPENFQLRVTPTPTLVFSGSCGYKGGDSETEPEESISVFFVHICLQLAWKKEGEPAQPVPWPLYQQELLFWPASLVWGCIYWRLWVTEWHTVSWKVPSVNTRLVCSVHGHTWNLSTSEVETGGLGVQGKGSGDASAAKGTFSSCVRPWVQFPAPAWLPTTIS